MGMKSNIIAEAHRRKASSLWASLALILAIGMAQMWMFWSFSTRTVYSAKVPPSDWSMTSGTTPW
jgi:hypothetical protein